MPGYSLSENFEGLPDMVYSLLPRHVVYHNGSSPTCTPFSEITRRDAGDHYCKAEFEIVAERYILLGTKEIVDSLYWRTAADVLGYYPCRVI